VRFGEDYDGLRVHVRDLDAPNTMSDPILRGYTHQFLGAIDTGQRPTMLDRVRELVELLLPTGRCSVEHVARSLGVDRRTVHRRLASEGQTFTSLVDATRRDLAQRLVRAQNRPLTEVAEMLGFSSHSNFTRWFRSRFGCSPSQWPRAV
jgi:AraC-like DNA-binding protein